MKLFNQFELTKKQLISAIIILIALLAIPLGVYLASHPQIFKGKAAEPTDTTIFHRPAFDTGVGIHWSGSTGDYTRENAQNLVCLLKDMGISWIKVLASGASAVEFAGIMRRNDIEPIVRLYRDRPVPNPLPESDLNAVASYVAQGVSYFESTNEPNIDIEWQGQMPSDCNTAVSQTMQSWVQDAANIQRKGGIPLFPALAPGGIACDHNDLNFLRASFGWLQSNNCTLADGTESNCLALFDTPHSNNKPAVMSVHNYDLNHDNSKNGDGSINFYTQDSNGFLQFSFYDNIIRQFLGRSIPILATEDGTRVGIDNQDNRFPTTDAAWHRDVTVGIAQYQMNNTSPYFFNTAFWLGIPNPDGYWGDQAWFNRDLSPILPETINGLKNLSKKSRNGSSQQTSCLVTTSPLPTPTPSSAVPTATPIISDATCKITQASTISAACAQCILNQQTGLRGAYNAFSLSNCSNQKIITHWCTEFNQTSCSQLKTSTCQSVCQ